VQRAAPLRAAAQPITLVVEHQVESVNLSAKKIACPISG
jgi:hypothetical protein